MIVNYTEEIHGIKFRFSAEMALRPFAEPLLEAIEHIPAERIKDGFRIRAGFSTFLLSEHNGGFDIAAPDFTDDPLTALNTDLTTALEIQYRQVLLLKKLGVMGDAVHFYDKMAVAKGALEKDNLVMTRFKEMGSSGWQVNSYSYGDNGKAEIDDTGVFEPVFVYKLMVKRPELLDFMCLPYGYTAVFRGEDLAELFDDEGESLIYNS